MLLDEIGEIDASDELRNLVRFVSQRVVGPDEAADLADDVLVCVNRDLGVDYPWPGNVRELEQCVRNVLVRKRYHPPAAANGGASEEIADAWREGSLTARELIRRYCTLVYAKTGSYQETARRLGLDRRTVKRNIDPDRLTPATEQPS